MVITGKYFDMVKEHIGQMNYPASFLSDKYSDVKQWQEEARAEVRKLLNYNPPETPLDTAIHDEYIKDGLVYQHISYAQPYGPRTEGILMRPENIQGKLPGFIALHDHGAYKYYGKEKITLPKNSPECMREYRDMYYGGRAWASELAARGYIVFVPDLFLWGSRKIRPEDIPPQYLQQWQSGLDCPEGSEEYIDAYNKYASYAESDIAKTFIKAGMSWAGIVIYEDMRAMDFLLTQPYVDSENIGCAGLSGGGLRTVLLSAMDERIKCSCCVGFMSTSAELALYKVYTHTWMLYIPGLTNLMDFADLYSMHGVKPAMVLYDTDDPLYTAKGQEEADGRLKRIYEKMGSPELYSGHFFPGPHKFDREMQDTAFRFFDKWLK
ncbi:MAG: S9 family peptidase [Oscillospiraceae bacterium]|nr:S9 family peptidase [Oscillospiraceae bacterium]